MEIFSTDDGDGWGSAGERVKKDVNRVTPNACPNDPSNPRHPCMQWQLQLPPLDAR
jgi:hypothetical protein